MRWLLDLALAFLALGVIEALVKPLARRFVQRRILAAAPLLFRQLDPLLPALLQRCLPCSTRGLQLITPWGR